MAFAVSTTRAWPLSSVDHGPAPLNGPANACYQARAVMTCALCGDATLGQGTFGTWHVLPSTSMVDSVTGLRYAECSRAPHCVTDGRGFPMQTTSCTWPQVVPVGEDPAAHGHWCAFTDLYHAMPMGHHAMPCQLHVDHARCLLSTLRPQASACGLLGHHYVLHVHGMAWHGRCL